MESRLDCIREPEGLTVDEKLRHYGYELSGRKVETLPGDPRIGRITYVKQIHKVLGQEHLMSREQKEALIRYQYEIYKELSRSKAIHVFAEGVRPEDLEIYTDGEFREIRKAMRNPNNMREMLINYGGAILYVAGDPRRRFLHPTENREILEKSLDYEMMHGCLSREIQEERESHVTKLIGTFLEKNKGKHVFLVFGAGHIFDDNIRKVYEGKPIPFVETVGFTNLARSLFFADEKAIEQMKQSPSSLKEKDHEFVFGFPRSR